MCSSVASPISVSSARLESPDHGSSVHSYFDHMSLYCQQEPMCIDELHAVNPDLLSLSVNPTTHIKSSDEGTVIDDDMMDVIQQTIQEVSMGCLRHDPGEFTVPLSICVSNSSTTKCTNSNSTVVTPTHSGATSSNDSYKGGQSSRPCSPNHEFFGRKKKLKTRHARGTGSTLPPDGHNTSFSPYTSPPTPATPVSTPVNSCPSSPGGSGYHSGQSGPFDKHSRRGSLKSGAEESGSEGKGSNSKVPRHKRPSHIRAEFKRRNKIQVNVCRNCPAKFTCKKLVIGPHSHPTTTIHK